MKQIDELQKKLEAAVQARFADDAINGIYNIARLLITACRERDEEIARLREALEWYADPANTRPQKDGFGGTITECECDEGNIARAALAEREDYRVG